MLDDDVWRYLPLPPVLTLVLVVVGAAAAVGVALVRTPRSHTLTIALLVAAVLAVLALTARGTLANANGEFSWRLGESIRGGLTNVNRALGLVNVLGNVAMFAPIGWFVALLAGRRPIVVGTVAALTLSGLVEVWQMLSGSFGDVDDLVLNTLGGLSGAAAAVALRAGARAVRERRTPSPSGTAATDSPA